MKRTQTRKQTRKQTLPSMSAQTAHEGIRRSAGRKHWHWLLWAAGWQAGKTKVRVDCMHGKVARNGAEDGKIGSSPSGRAEVPWQAGWARAGRQPI
jgi:hypothetical protein